MKKPACLLIVCLLSVMTGKTNPVVDNSSIRKSKKEQSKQTKEFTNDKRYSSVVNSAQGKAQRKQQAKAGKGKGL